MRMILAILLPSFVAHASPTSDNAQQREPVKLAHIARLKQKDPQETFRVRDTNGNVVAQISRVVLDESGSRPRFALLYLFDNVAQHRPLIVAPWETLSINTNSTEVYIESDQNRLREAQVVKDGQVPDRAPNGWGKEHYAFYGIEPRDLPSEPQAVGAAALIGGTKRGSAGEQGRKAAVAFNRGDALYIVLAATLAGFALIMVARRLRQDRREENP